MGLVPMVQAPAIFTPFNVVKLGLNWVCFGLNWLCIGLNWV